MSGQGLAKYMSVLSWGQMTMTREKQTWRCSEPSPASIVLPLSWVPSLLTAQWTVWAGATGWSNAHPGALAVPWSGERQTGGLVCVCV